MVGSTSRFKRKIKNILDRIKRRRERRKRINEELKKLDHIIKSIKQDTDLILSSSTGRKAFLDTYRESADITGIVPIIALTTISTRFDELRVVIQKNDPYSPFGSIENVKKFANALGNFFAVLGYSLDSHFYGHANRNFYSLNQLLKLRAAGMFLPFVKEDLASWSSYYQQLFKRSEYMALLGGQEKKKIHDRLVADYPELFS